mgnify:CR=1 FL=1
MAKELRIGTHALQGTRSYMEDRVAACRLPDAPACVRLLHREGAQIEIGGNERYVSLCRRHWNEAMAETALHHRIQSENDKRRRASAQRLLIPKSGDVLLSHAESTQYPRRLHAGSTQDPRMIHAESTQNPQNVHYFTMSRTCKTETPCCDIFHIS